MNLLYHNGKIPPTLSICTLLIFFLKPLSLIWLLIIYPAIMKPTTESCVLKLPLPRPLICIVPSVCALLSSCPSHPCWPMCIPKRTSNLGLQDKIRDRQIQPLRKLQAASCCPTSFDKSQACVSAEADPAASKSIVHGGIEVVSTWRMLSY